MTRQRTTSGRGVVRASWGKRALLPLFAALCVLVPAAAHAVTVWPTTVFIDSRTRTATLTLSNTGLRPEEIEIDFAFGVPMAGADGRVQVIFLDSAGLPQRSIVDHVRAFPRRMRLEPGQTQLVRLLVQPPEGLPDGEYWGRVMVASVGGQPPIQQQQGNVSMEITVRTVIAVGLYYRHGQVETNLRIAGASASPDAGVVSLLLDLERGGNAAFLGRIVSEVVDEAGEVVASHVEQIAVHDDIRWRVDVPLPEGIEFTPGFRIRYTVEAVREGANEGLLLIDPIGGEVAVVR